MPSSSISTALRYSPKPVFRISSYARHTPYTPKKIQNSITDERYRDLKKTAVFLFIFISPFFYLCIFSVFLNKCVEKACERVSHKLGGIMHLGKGIGVGAEFNKQGTLCKALVVLSRSKAYRTRKSRIFYL